MRRSLSTIWPSVSLLGQAAGGLVERDHIRRRHVVQHTMVRRDDIAAALSQHADALRNLSTDIVGRAKRESGLRADGAKEREMRSDRATPSAKPIEPTGTRSWGERLTASSTRSRLLSLAIRAISFCGILCRQPILLLHI